MRPGEKAILPVWFRAGLVICLSATLILAYTNRLSAKDPSVISEADKHGAMVQSTELHFVDLPDGMISVIDAAAGQEITRLHSGEDGFMRSVMRGMVRERKAKGIGAEIPFQLSVWEDGLVSLIDPATHRRVELSAFGPDNVAAFTRLLAARPGEPDRSLPAT